MTTRLARRVSFTSTHRYEVHAWTSARNAEVFGNCFTPSGHGHCYEFEVFLEGAVDTQTGMILNLAEVDQVLREVVAPVDGKNLNTEVTEFAEQVPTTERLAMFLFARAQARFDRDRVRLAKVRLFEYEDLWVEIWP